MDLFPDIEQAVPLPHEEVLRYMVCKIRDNRSEEWLTEMCRKNNLSDVCQDFLHKGVLKGLEGEPDVSFYPPRLTIELVPRSCWFDNVRSAVSSTDWKRLRQQTARRAGWKCQVCGGKGPRWPVECHEIWHYDDDRQCQTLTGLIALCPSCHEVKHMGFSELRGKKDEAVAHLALVNGWSLQGAFDYVDEAFDVWQERSRHAWQLDISWLEAQGIKRQDETAAEGENIPAENQLSLELEVPPVATESTAVSAVVEQESNSGEMGQILKCKPVSRSSSAWPAFLSVCQRVFYQVKKVIREQW
ncbi:HNH endonuclease [Klebsiella variicola]|uniref:HNH endonuclease n=1 Tax=Klebsiella variicola TaxID=244366 RepID=UPI003982632A